MDSSTIKPEAAANPTPRPDAPRPTEADSTHRPERLRAARAGESVTAYDDLWFERRPIS